MEKPVRAVMLIVRAGVVASLVAQVFMGVR